MTSPISNSSIGVAAALPIGKENTSVPENLAEEKTNLVAQQSLSVQTDTTKCWSCKKKVGLLGFKCRCSYIFCSLHRHSDKHPCTFDYKAEQREKLTKANPVVIASKVPPI
jgi:hypothetical protein